jgi:hypothetical protein
MPLSILSRRESISLRTLARMKQARSRAMTTATATRRLAAILAADVVGYSRLIGGGRGRHARTRQNASRRTHRSENPRASRADRQDHRRRRAGGICQRRRRARCAGEIQAAMADRVWISPRSAACDFASGLMTGSIEEVILLMEQAVRLSPPDPQIALMYYRIGELHLLQSRTDEVIASLEGARSANLICARPAYRRNDRHGLKDGGSRLDATVRRKWSARSASRRLGRYDRDGGRCRSVRQIALR